MQASLLGKFFDEVAEFGKDEFFHGEATAFSEPGVEKSTAVNDTSGGAGHDGRRADILVGERPKDLTKPIQPFFQHRIDGFKCRIPPRDTGSAVNDDGLNCVGS